MNNWSVVEALRHARHDWMNKLQLIKGNLALNKIENVERIMDEMIMEARQEARLSNLKLPQFAELLLTFNWQNHPFQLDYEILDESCSLPVDDEKISKWIAGFFDILERSIEPFQENYLSISFEQFSENVRFYFDFSGTIKEKNRINNWITNQQEIKKVLIQELSAEKFIAEVTI